MLRIVAWGLASLAIATASVPASAALVLDPSAAPESALARTPIPTLEFHVAADVVLDATVTAAHPESDLTWTPPNADTMRFEPGETPSSGPHRGPKKPALEAAAMPVIPEPSTLLLLGSGLIALVRLGRHRPHGSDPQRSA